MDNPYQSPSPVSGSDFSPPQAPLAIVPGLVGQVRVVSILMMVQGGLELFMGGTYVVMGTLLPIFVKSAAQSDPNFRRGGGPEPEFMFWLVGGVYLGGGLVTTISGIVRIIAGIRNYQFRNRVLGIVSCILGFGTIVTCYCMPTSIALAIYGMIVLFNAPVVAAFQLRAQGYTPDQILAMTYGQFTNIPPPKFP